MKNPSDPSLITSAISCIAFGPVSLLSISQSIQMLMKMNSIEKFHAVNEIRLDVVEDTNM